MKISEKTFLELVLAAIIIVLLVIISALTGCAEHATDATTCEEELTTCDEQIAVYEDTCASSVQLVGATMSVNGCDSECVCDLLTHYIEFGGDIDELTEWIDPRIGVERALGVCGLEVGE
jgi:hypothetical protein